MDIKKIPADRVWVDQNDGVAVVLKDETFTSVFIDLYGNLDAISVDSALAADIPDVAPEFGCEIKAGQSATAGKLIVEFANNEAIIHIKE